MAVDPVEVRRLLLVSRAAHMRRLQAATARNRLAAKRYALEALEALQAAGTLDPDRAAPAWVEGTPRERIAVQEGMVGFYVRYIARAEAAGL